MACFMVPAAEAVVTTMGAKIMKAKETNQETEVKIPFSTKLGWLNKLLWGGSALLAFEHVWHGEIEPMFPFLTAAGNPADAAEMLHEMSTAGAAMAVLVTAVWGGMLAVASVVEKRERKAHSAEE